MASGPLLKHLPLLCTMLLVAGVVLAKDSPAEEAFFTGPVPRLQIEISREAMKVLREYTQEHHQPRPERLDVKATVREGGQIYTNVAIHRQESAE